MILRRLSQIKISSPRRMSTPILTSFPYSSLLYMEAEDGDVEQEAGIAWVALSDRYNRLE